MDGEGMHCNKPGRQSSDKLNHSTRHSACVIYLTRFKFEGAEQLDVLQDVLTAKHLRAEK